jgi:hypothetical protein
MHRALAQDVITGESDDCPTGGGIARRGIVVGLGMSVLLWGGIAWAVVQAAAVYNGG